MLQSAGDLDGAAAAYRKAVALQPDLARAHCNLGNVLKRQGRFAESLTAYERGHELGAAAGWSYPSGEWVAEARRLVAAEGKLADVLAGWVSPAAAEDHVGYAVVCQATNRFAAAARLYHNAFALDPAVATAVRRYDAACCAGVTPPGPRPPSGRRSR